MDIMPGPETRVIFCLSISDVFLQQINYFERIGYFLFFALIH